MEEQELAGTQQVRHTHTSNTNAKRAMEIPSVVCKRAGQIPTSHPIAHARSCVATCFPNLAATLTVTAATSSLAQSILQTTLISPPILSMEVSERLHVVRGREGSVPLVGRNLVQRQNSNPERREKLPVAAHVRSRRESAFLLSDRGGWSEYRMLLMGPVGCRRATEGVCFKCAILHI